MSAKRKKIKIGFDLDGVIIGKPFFVPHTLMEWLVRSRTNLALAYRYPDLRFERLIRYFSHHPLLRPPINKNIKLIHQLYKSNKYELYVVSSRYSFLEKRTKQWFKFYNLHGLFKYIYINLNNEQPHIYKAKMIKNLKLDVFIDDDLPLLNYLKKHLDSVTLLYMEDKNTTFENLK
jgi:uncharacterized HAD superfamily protein